MRTSAIRGISIWALCVLAAAACTGASPERSAEPPARDTTPARVPRADTTGALPPPVLAGDAQWSYRLAGGWLSEMEGYDRNDPHASSKEYEVEHRAECRGRAVVRPCASADCWMWSVKEKTCTGKGEGAARVDWLNVDDPQTLRRVDGRWTLSPSLIGRGECGAEPSLDGKGELVRLAFTCEWKCSPGDPCEGGAEYEFVRDSTTVRS